jgi:hypothetical protein
MGQREITANDYVRIKPEYSDDARDAGIPTGRLLRVIAVSGGKVQLESVTGSFDLAWFQYDFSA